MVKVEIADTRRCSVAKRRYSRHAYGSFKYNPDNIERLNTRLPTDEIPSTHDKRFELDSDGFGADDGRNQRYRAAAADVKPTTHATLPTIVP